MSYQTIPYVIAFANEERRDRLMFRPHAGSDGGMRLSYDEPRRGDWVRGVLRARVGNLRRRTALRGPERMRKLNTKRQWECMDYTRCQVCSRPATDPSTGLAWWLLVPSVFEPTADSPGGDWWQGRTNAPPTCQQCIPIAMEECPMLQHAAGVYTVTTVESAGVLADMYRPGPDLSPELSAHNVYVAWDAFAYHPRALAVSQVVHLYGMKRVS